MEDISQYLNFIFCLDIRLSHKLCNILTSVELPHCRNFRTKCITKYIVHVYISASCSDCMPECSWYLWDSYMQLGSKHIMFLVCTVYCALIRQLVYLHSVGLEKDCTISSAWAMVILQSLALSHPFVSLHISAANITFHWWLNTDKSVTMAASVEEHRE